MSPLAVAFLFFAMIGVLVLPRRWAALSLLCAGCYLPTSLSFSLGPFNFYALRLLLTVAILRAVIRKDGLANGMHGLDWVMVIWATAALTSSLLHDDIAATLVNRSGLVFTTCGTYFMFRAFCRSADDIIAICRIVAIVLIPIAIAMVYERFTGINAFSAFGGVQMSDIRGGSFRAQGPFGHSILAGTVGAVSLPLMAPLWKPYRGTAIFGFLACFSMIFSSSSSGPIMSGAFSLAALLMWPLRYHMRFVRWAAVFGYIAMDMVMKAPAYYLLARIDLTGSSTSWHRAALIETAIDHWSEWWLAGTDHTRHWMPYGVPWSGNHIDITNHYLRMGVDGGMPLMLLFIWVLAKGFSMVGQTLRQSHEAQSVPSFVAWALGAALFSHAATFMSVSYFDQSVTFLYLTLATIGLNLIQQVPPPIREAITLNQYRDGSIVHPVIGER
jgi:hypothetical protein